MQTININLMSKGMQKVDAKVIVMSITVLEGGAHIIVSRSVHIVDTSRGV